MKIRLLPLALLTLFLVGCPDKKDDPAKGGDEPVPTAVGDGVLDEDDEPAAPTVRPLTAADLQPVIREMGAADVIPNQILVEFALGVVDAETVGREAESGTVLRVVPPIEGKATWLGESTLAFVPTGYFAPDTRYDVVLEAVQTRTGLVKAPLPNPWTHRFKTPRFGFVAIALNTVDYKRHSIEVDVLFSAPVEQRGVQKAASFAIDGRRVSRIQWSSVGPKGRTQRRGSSQIIRARIIDPNVKPNAVVSLDLSEGVFLAGDDAQRADGAKAQLELEGGKPMSITHVYAHEGGNGFYIEVICNDQSVEGRRYYWDRIDQTSYWDHSRRCVLDEDDTTGIHFSPPVKFSVSPSGGGFRIFGDFARGTYQMRIDAGVRTTDGGLLMSAFEKNFSIPAREAQVSFVAQGRYLPRSAWDKLAIRHMNLEKVELVIRHVPERNLVFWMSNDSQEAVDARTGEVVVKHTVPLRGEPDTLTTSWIDVAALLPAETGGLLELRLEEGAATASARLLLTDLHLVAKRSGASPEHPWGKRVQVWALNVDDVALASGVVVQLIKRSGKVVDTCTVHTYDGCELEVSEGDVDDTPPFALIARRGKDLTYLKFDELKTGVEDVRVHGEAYESEQKYRAAIYSDRGVYRPGDTAHLVALVRAANSLSPRTGMPVRLELLDPQSKVIKRFSLKVNEAGLVTQDVTFPAFATTGHYRVRMKVAKKVIGEYAFQVEEFVPERMKVKARAVRPGALRGESADLLIEARYLFGGVPADHRVELTCTLAPSIFAPKDNANFHYGTWSADGAAPKSLSLGSVTGALDAEGKGTLTCPGGNAGGFQGAAKLLVQAAVFESGSGRTTVGRTSVPVHPERFYVGLSSATQKAKKGQPIVVSGVVVDWNGKLDKSVSEVKIELHRMETEYGWYYDDAAGEETYRRWHRPVAEVRTVAKVKNGKFTIELTPSASAEAYLIRARAGEARTDLRVEGSGNWYWWGADESGNDQTPRPDKPSWIALETPKTIEVGKATTITFIAPYKGRALLTAETNEILAHEWREVEAGPVEWTFTLDEFVPNVYVAAFVIKDPRLDSEAALMPDRSFGVQSVTVRPTEFTHTVKLTVPKEVRSNSVLEVTLDLGETDGPTFATVAAVDEGILSLTGFETPDPSTSIFVRRGLNVDTFETIGWTLLVPPSGPSSSTGGDAGEGDLGRVQPVKPVALWSGLVEVGKDGKVTVKFDVPQYRGALRIMAVTSSHRRMGHAEASVLVRDPLVVQATLPRFLTYGDTIQIPIFVTNLSGKDREVQVTLNVENLPVPGIAESRDAPLPVEVLGTDLKTLNIADGANGIVVFQARTRRASGAARFKVVVTSGKLRSEEEADVPLLPAGPKTRTIQRIRLDAGDTDLKPYLTGWTPMSERSTFWVTNNPYGDSFDHLKHLIRYPYGCIEQTTSSTRPLLFVSTLLHNVDPSITAEKKVDDMVMSGIDRVFSMQTPSGGFAMWQGGTEPTYWGTAYATHMLLDARKLRYPVPEDRLDDALDWMEKQVARFERGQSGRERVPHFQGDAEPYMHYVLAMAARGKKGRVNKLVKKAGEADGRDAEKLYMLKAAAYLAGDHRYERDLKHPDLEPFAKNERHRGWSFYSDRRARGFLLSTFVDLFENDPAGARLASAVAEGLRGQRSSWYSTQELVWGVTGLGKWVTNTPADFDPPVLTAGGKKLKPQSAPPGVKTTDRTWSLARASEYESLSLEVPRKGEGDLWLILSSEGVSTTANWKTGGSGLKLTREFLTAEGKPLQLHDGSHTLGELVYVRVKIKNTTVERLSNIVLVDRLPAGWEIENPRLGRGRAVDWIDSSQLWDAQNMNVRDDRIEVFGSLNRNEEKFILYGVRAVTAGQFAIPTVEAEAMYDPSVWAREAGDRVEIAGPWSGYLN